MFIFPRHLNRAILLACAFLATACTHQAASVDSHSPSVGSQTGDRRVLAGTWEYIDSTGAVVQLTLDDHGNGPYEWKEGRFETHRLIEHTWSGMWFQVENDREGGFTVEFSPDFSAGAGQWWYSRIGTDTAPSLKGGTFRLRSISSG